MTHKIVGQYSNSEVTLLSEPMVCTAKQLQVGDIVELDGEYVRMYRDGHTDALRFWFITDLVLEAMVQRHMPAVRQQFAADAVSQAVQ